MLLLVVVLCVYLILLPAVVFGRRFVDLVWVNFLACYTALILVLLVVCWRFLDICLLIVYISVVCGLLAVVLLCLVLIYWFCCLMFVVSFDFILMLGV